ncbi:MAG: glycosyltransferase [Vicinamibacterales bacterium]
MINTRSSGLRVLLGVPWYFPDSVGGTEIYVRGLARELQASGVQVAIAAPANSLSEQYDHQGVPVFRFPAQEGDSGPIDLRRSASSEWVTVLESFQPSIVDLHSLTSDLELAHLKAVRRRGIHSMVTLHVPGVVCARGTFMRFGKRPCSGELSVEPCTACRLQALGWPRPLGWALSHVPGPVSDLLDSSRVPAGARRAALASRRDRDRREWLQQIVEHVDRVVAPSRWLVEALARNGVPKTKLTLCRQGVDQAHAQSRVARVGSGVLRVGFVGRYDPVKGLHVLVDAVMRLSADTPVELHVWGVARTTADREYRAHVQQRANGDPRLVFHEETADVGHVYRSIDVLAVPSIWLETGPLVVLEAQAAGLPVVGSDLGGIRERVTNGKDGLLVPFDDPSALGEAIALLARHPERLEQLRPSVPPRTTADVARETLSIYNDVVTGRAA